MARVHHLSCGTMCPIGGARVTGHEVFVCHVLLVETKDGLVVVDSGYGLADVRDATRLGLARRLIRPVLREEETVLRRVEALGFSASDVRHVVLTHLDVDHAGGIADFPHATIHATATEHDAATARRTFKERERYRAAHFAHGPRWELHGAFGERWMGFDAVRAIERTDADVLVVPLAGHTRGHAAIAVRAEGGAWLLHCGDAYFHGAEVRGADGRAPFGLQAFLRVNAIDDGLRRRNLERLRELARREPDIQLFCAHDPEELRALGGVP